MLYFKSYEEVVKFSFVVFTRNKRGKIQNLTVSELLGTLRTTQSPLPTFKNRVP